MLDRPCACLDGVSITSIFAVIMPAMFNELHADGVIRRGFGVYLGDRPMQDGAVRVLPIAAFLRELPGGRVLAAAR